MPRQLPESEKARAVRAYTFELRLDGKLAPNGLFSLPLAPQSTRFSEPTRSSVQHTLADYYAEEAGSGPKQIALDGHTGFAVKQAYRGAEKLDGYQGFLKLREIFRTYHKETRANLMRPDKEVVKVELILHMWEENEHWRVIPNGNEGFTRTRNAQQPLLFSYAISLLGMDDLQDALSADAAGLRTKLLQSPDVDRVLDNVAAALAFIKNAIATSGSLGQGLLKAIDGVGSTVKNAADFLAGGLTSIVNFAKGGPRGWVGAIAKEFGGIGKLIDAGRTLMKTFSQASVAVSEAIAWSREMRRMVCNLKHLSLLQNAENALRPVLNPLLRQWDLARREVVVC